MIYSESKAFASRLRKLLLTVLFTGMTLLKFYHSGG